MLNIGQPHECSFHLSQQITHGMFIGVKVAFYSPGQIGDHIAPLFSIDVAIVFGVQLIFVRTQPCPSKANHLNRYAERNVASWSFRLRNRPYSDGARFCKENWPLKLLRQMGLQSSTSPVTIPMRATGNKLAMVKTPFATRTWRSFIPPRDGLESSIHPLTKEQRQMIHRQTIAPARDSRAGAGFTLP